MSRGTINVSRELWDDTAFADEVFSEREAWVWMLAEASWKRREKRVGRVVVETERGQIAASVRFMAERFGWSKSRVHRFLGRLKKRDMIGTADGTGCLIITICNYDEYQSPPSGGGTPVDREAGQKRDRSGTNEKKGERRVKEGQVEPDGSSLAHANPISEAIAIYNEIAESTSWPLVQKVTPARRKSLNARLNDCGGMEGWRHAMDRARASDFLSGRNGRWGGCGFDWLTKQANFTKLMEGNYDNRTGEKCPGGMAGGSKAPGRGSGGSLASIAARRRAASEN